MEKYIFRKSVSNVFVLFQREKIKLRRILPKNSIIEHIGSTSVPRLGGKGIVDIIISVDKKNFERTKQRLLKNKYRVMLRENTKERFSFEKDYKYGSKIRRVHIHLIPFSSPLLRRNVVLRDYLRKHPEIVKQYVQVKKKGIKLAKGKGKIYREYKRNFLDKIEEKALKEFK